MATIECLGLRGVLKERCRVRNRREEKKGKMRKEKDKGTKTNGMKPGRRCDKQNSVTKLEAYEGDKSEVF